MYMRLALCFSLVLCLNACTSTDGGPSSGSANGASGSEVARPGPRQAGVIGR